MPPDAKKDYVDCISYHHKLKNCRDSASLLDEMFRIEIDLTVISSSVVMQRIHTALTLSYIIYYAVEKQTVDTVAD